MDTTTGRDLQRRLMLAGVESPDLDACSRLAKNAATLHRLDEDSCNGPGTYYREPQEAFSRRLERWERRVEKHTHEAEARVRRIAGELGLGVEFQGDPRGAPFGLVLDSADPEWSTVWVPGVRP